MHSKLRPSPAMVIALIALFVSLGGTAAALSGSNTVFTDDIVNDQVYSADVRNDSLSGGGLAAADLRPSSVGTSEVAADSLGAGDLAPNSVGGSEVAPGSIFPLDLNPSIVDSSKVEDNSLTGADINESTLALDGFFEAESATGSCNDDSETGTSCASTGITLASSGQLLVNASGRWYTSTLDDDTGPSAGTDLTGSVFGNCVLRVDGTSIGPSTSMGERSEGGTFSNHPNSSPGTMALTGLSSVLAAGAHTVDVFCTEVDGDIDWSDISLTAARIDN